MKKTGEEIELDVFKLIKSSSIATEIGGDVYRSGMRPYNSNDEDCVVGFLTGLDGQIQEGVVNVNVYVPDVDNGSQLLVKDISRCTEIAGIMRDITSSLISSEYYFSIDAMIKTYRVEDDNVTQHYVNTRLKFRLITD